MIEVLYEDNHVIVVYKLAGILSQSDGSNKQDLVTAIKKYLVEEYNKPGDAYLGLVHRLDTNTSGVMVFAKTSKAASRLNEDIKNNRFYKKYLAAVKSHPHLRDKATLTNYLQKNEKEKKSYVVDKTKGKEAILYYEVREVYKDYALVDIDLKTGRHHQIRVQFSHINCPLFGDIKYGGKKNDNFYLALQAYQLSFYHPTTKELMTFEKKLKTNIFRNFKGL